MKILENLKLDTWFGVMLYVGVLMMAASIFVDITFLEEKHLFGLGMGMFVFGLSFRMAEKYQNTFNPPHLDTGPATFFEWKVIKHNTFSIITLIIGLGLICLFGVMVLIDLI